MLLNRLQKQMARDVVGDCEAFLTGRLLEHYSANGEHVTASTWTNLLAHGDEEALLRVQRGRGDSIFMTGGTWASARSYLVTEILDLVSRHGSLAELQRTVLVPLELRLATDHGTDEWEVGTWVAAVLDTLAAYSRRCERAERHCARDSGSQDRGAVRSRPRSAA
jgi:hypothetical protein